MGSSDRWNECYEDNKQLINKLAYIISKLKTSFLHDYSVTEHEKILPNPFLPSFSANSHSEITTINYL